jgi:hypothetical protein
MRNRVEVVGVQVGDDDQIHPIQDAFGRHWQIHQGVGRFSGVGWPRMFRREEGVGQDVDASIVEQQGGVADELEAHQGIVR